MKRKTKLFGYRTHTLWKSIVATIYYLVCFILIIKGLFIKPNSGEISSWIIGVALLMPALMTSNFKIKKFIPILRHHRNVTDVFGFLNFLLLFLILSIFFFTPPKDKEVIELLPTKLEEVHPSEESDCLIVHYIDVGQGDAIFIELFNDETILIDAGEEEYGQVVANYIKNLGYDDITYLIATHPHSDHIGGFLTIVNEFDIANIYMPKVVSNSLVYEDLLLAIKEKGYSIKTAKKGVELVNLEDLDVFFLSPTYNNYKNINNYSAVLKINYKDRSFLFMGDAEKQVEKEISNDCQSDVIKVGHHGSDTSSTSLFVNLVRPQYAIISVGANNDYGHPASSVIKRWKNSGAIVYRTDLNGNIIVKTNGYNLNILTSN